MERNRGGQKKNKFGDNVKEWTGLNSVSSSRLAENMTRWKKEQNIIE